MTPTPDPVVSPADTPAYKRLAAMLAEGEGLDDAQPMYSPLGELRAFKAEMDALLAVGERDKAELENALHGKKLAELDADNERRILGETLAERERDRQQIARLTEALAGLVASVRYHPPRSDWLAWRSECGDAASKLLAEEDIARAEKMFLHAADFDDLNPAAVLAGEEDAPPHSFGEQGVRPEPNHTWPQPGDAWPPRAAGEGDT